jgi:hypothetical protein
MAQIIDSDEVGIGQYHGFMLLCTRLGLPMQVGASIVWPTNRTGMDLRAPRRLERKY